MTNFTSYGVFDPGILVRQQNAADGFRGQSKSAASQHAQDEIVISVYSRNGVLYPVNVMVSSEDGILNYHEKLASKTLPSMINAHKVMDIPLKAFNEVWSAKDDMALANKHEALEAVMSVVESMSESPEGAAANGVRFFDALGRPKQPIARVSGGKAAPVPYV